MHLLCVAQTASYLGLSCLTPRATISFTPSLKPEVWTLLLRFHVSNKCIRKCSETVLVDDPDREQLPVSLKQRVAEAYSKNSNTSLCVLVTE